METRVLKFTIMRLYQLIFSCLISSFMYSQPCRFWPIFDSITRTAAIPFGNVVTFNHSNPANLSGPFAYSVINPSNWFTPDPNIATTSPPNSTAHNVNDLGVFSIFPVVNGETGTISFNSITTTGFFLHVIQPASKIEFDHSFTLISQDGDLIVGSSMGLTNNVLDASNVTPTTSPDDANATIFFDVGINQINYFLSTNNIGIDGFSLAFTFPDNCIDIINTYTPVLAFEPCTNKITVEDASTFNTSDTVLLIQMKGVVIDSSNTSNFGTITDYKNSGNYEFNYVKNKSGNIIELKNALTRQYDIPNGKVQLVRVPYFQNINITSTLTCLPWDGNKGGVLVLNVQDTVTLNAGIDVSGKGFKGGIAVQNTTMPEQCDIDSFYITNNFGGDGSAKGEGIFLNIRMVSGRGKAANGGGGGNAINSGGAGGGNCGKGGEGGKEWIGCNNNFINGGIGGLSLNYNNILNRIYLGGGGGAGHAENFKLGDGGNGGGIVIINTNYLKSNSKTIRSDGKTPVHIIGEQDDGRAGGGGGGTILINYGNLLDSASTSSKGGNGDNCIAIPDWFHGPGGGGGGGIIWINKPVNDPLLSTTTSGGIPGTNLNIGNNPWGATAGQNGSILFNLTIPVANIPFVPGAISSLLTISICQGQNYAGYTTSGTYIDTLISVYGCDSIRTLILTVKPGSYSSIAQTICSGQTYSGYNVSGTYIDTLLATNGCDSIRTLILTVNPKSYSAVGQTICSGQTYSGYSTSGNYIDTLVAANGCDSIRTLQLAVLPRPSPDLGADKNLCSGDSLILYPGQFDSYLWQDGTTQNHVTVKQPGLYSVVVTNNCGTAKDEIIIKEKICDIYFPSSFTPNHDGKNDLFKILGAYNLSDYHLTIYNRWGQRVFETADYLKGWNGIVNGQLQETATFVWYCEFNKSGNPNKTKMKGTVTLIR
jgi:gliding motility-associated-like protein